MTNQLDNLPSVNSPSSQAGGKHAAVGGTADTGASGSTGPSDGSGQYVRVRKKRKHAKKNKGLRIAAIVIGVILAIVIGVALALFMVNQQMSNMIKDVNNNAVITAGSTTDNGQTIKHNGHTYKLNQSMVSVLIIGHDDEDRTSGGQNQADMVSVAAFDTNSGNITIIGIPRDSMVTVDKYGLDADGNRTSYAGQAVEQICLAYSYGKGIESITNVEAAVERTLYGIPITYYFDMDEAGISEINDVMGGVTVTALQDVPKANITAGEQVHLMGKQAYYYVQYRDTKVDGSSLGRQERQAQYLKAFTSQLFQMAAGNATMFVDLFNTASEYTTTNMDASAVIFLAQTAMDHGIDVANVVTLQGTMDTEGEYNKFYLDKESTIQTVLDVYYTQVD